MTDQPMRRGGRQDQIIHGLMVLSANSDASINAIVTLVKNKTGVAATADEIVASIARKP